MATYLFALVDVFSKIDFALSTTFAEEDLQLVLLRLLCCANFFWPILEVQSIDMMC